MLTSSELTSGLPQYKFCSRNIIKWNGSVKPSLAGYVRQHNGFPTSSELMLGLPQYKFYSRNIIEWNGSVKPSLAGYMRQHNGFPTTEDNSLHASSNPGLDLRGTAVPLPLTAHSPALPNSEPGVRRGREINKGCRGGGVDHGGY